MKCALIGCGLIGQKRVSNSQGATYIACVDPNSSLLMEFSKKNSIPHSFANVDSFFNSQILNEIDAIIIATPHVFLPEMIEKSLASNKHVFVEKPAGRFPHEIQHLVELAEQKKLKVRVGFNHRYHRAILKAKEIISNGDIGDIFFLRGRYGHGGRIGYNKEWRANPAISGGGELIDQGSHMIDLSRMFLGEFDKVLGHAVNYFWDMPVDDNAFLTLITKDGKTSFIHVSCTEWKNLFSLEIYGRNGKVQVDGLGGSYGVERLSFYKMLPEMGPPETYIWEYPMQDNSWQVEFDEFIKDIQEDREVLPSLKDALMNLQIIDHIYKNSNYDFY